MTHVNDIPVNDEAHAPFGGEKNSGLGRFNGEWAIEIHHRSLDQRADDTTQIPVLAHWRRSLPACAGPAIH
jgi:acyl-CoA reductase-like NAD-dependent aldehyde dehydrogenase